MYSSKPLDRYKYALVVLTSLLIIAGTGFAKPADKSESNINSRLMDPIKQFFSSEKDGFSETGFPEFNAEHYGNLLEAMKAEYDSTIKDYKGTFSKQERINKKLHIPQTMDFKFRNEPFSVFMEWKKNAGKIDRLLYVKGKNNNKMVVHPRGLLAWIKSIEREPRCKDVLKTSLRTCDQFGIRNLLNRVTGLYKGNVEDPNFSVKYIGTEKVDKRPCIVFESVMPNNKISPTRRLIMIVDVEYRLPVLVKSLDGEGNLISKYSYTSLKFNNWLKDGDFTKKANKL